MVLLNNLLGTISASTVNNDVIYVWLILPEDATYGLLDS